MVQMVKEQRAVPGGLGSQEWSGFPHEQCCSEEPGTPVIENPVVSFSRNSDLCLPE